MQILIGFNAILGKKRQFYISVRLSLAYIFWVLLQNLDWKVQIVSIQTFPPIILMSNLSSIVLFLKISKLSLHCLKKKIFLSQRYFSASTSLSVCTLNLHELQFGARSTCSTHTHTHTHTDR